MAMALAVTGVVLSVVGSVLPLNQAPPLSRFVNPEEPAVAWLVFGVWAVLWFFGRVVAAALATIAVSGPHRRVAAGGLMSLGVTLGLHPIASMTYTSLVPYDDPGIGAATLAAGGVLIFLAGAAGAGGKKTDAAMQERSSESAYTIAVWGTVAAIGSIAYIVVLMLVQALAPAVSYLFQIEQLGLAVTAGVAAGMLHRGRNPDVASGLLLGTGVAFSVRVPLELLPPLLAAVPDSARPLDATPAILTAAAGVLLLWAGVRSYRGFPASP